MMVWGSMWIFAKSNFVVKRLSRWYGDGGREVAPPSAS